MGDEVQPFRGSRLGTSCVRIRGTVESHSTRVVVRFMPCQYTAHEAGEYTVGRIGNSRSGCVLPVRSQLRGRSTEASWTSGDVPQGDRRGPGQRQRNRFASPAAPSTASASTILKDTSPAQRRADLALAPRDQTVQDCPSCRQSTPPKRVSRPPPSRPSPKRRTEKDRSARADRVCPMSEDENPFGRWQP